MARPMSVMEIAQPHKMSLPAVSKHLRYLEKAGLVRRTVKGRVHSFEIEQHPLRMAEAWLVYYLQQWNKQLDDLEQQQHQS